MSLRTWCFKLWDLMPILRIALLSRALKSPTNFNLESSVIQWARYSIITKYPPPGSFSQTNSPHNNISKKVLYPLKLVEFDLMNSSTEEILI